MQEACADVGFLSIGVAAGMLVAGLILGFCIGVVIGMRFRVKAALAAMLERVKPAAATGDDGGEDDDKEMDDEDVLTNALEELLQQFMSHDFVGGLDDHPETELNPILIYQVKKAKEEMRARKQLEAQLLARDLPLNYLETLSPEARVAFLLELKADPGPKLGANVGSVAGKVRHYGATVNSTRILVDAGARLTPSVQASLGEDDGNKAERAAQEVRERMKIIDNHLSTVSGVDVSREHNKRSSMQRIAGKGNLVQNALDMAKETKYNPFGGEATKRDDMKATCASRGRTRVAPPLDHAIAVSNERQRRGSCGLMGGGPGGGRRASSTLVGGGGSRPATAAVPGCSEAPIQ